MNQSKDFMDGFNEGYIQGQQDLIHKMAEIFLNSDEANSFHISGFIIKKDNTRKKRCDKIRDDYYCNSSWDFKRKI